MAEVFKHVDEGAEIGGRGRTSATRDHRRRAHRLRHDLKSSTIDGTAFCVMVGVGESYLGLFVLAAGLGQVMSGLVVTLPSLIGALLQLASLSGARLLGSLRRWTVAAASIQAAGWLALAILALTGWVPGWLVFLAAVLHYAGGLAAGASWTTWIGQLVPGRIRPRYFARRAWPCHMGTVVGLVVGGLILEWGVGTTERGHLDDAALADGGLAWFAVLFGLAFVARTISAYFLHEQSDTGPVNSNHVHVSPRAFVSGLWHRQDGRLIAAMILMTGAANIANPFWPAFLKDERAFTYAQIMVLMATSLVAKAFAQLAWGEVARRVGAWQLLAVSGVVVALLPALWLVHPSFEWMLVTQVISGIAWAGWELGTLLLALHVIPEHRRTSLWAQFNFTNAVVGFLGSLVGAQLLSGIMSSGDSGSMLRAFGAMFLLSVVARLGVLVWVMRARARFGPESESIMEGAEVASQARGDRS